MGITATTSSSSSSSHSHLVVESLSHADTILLQPVISWTSSFVVPIALISRLTQSIHASLLRSSSFSSPMWYYLQSLSYDVGCMGLAFLRGQTTPVELSGTSLWYVYLHSLSGVIVPHMVCVAACPSAHLRFCQFQFLHVGAIVTGTVVIPYSIYSWLNDHLVDLSVVVVMLPVDTTMAVVCQVISACCMLFHGSGCTW